MLHIDAVNLPHSQSLQFIPLFSINPRTSQRIIQNTPISWENHLPKACFSDDSDSLRPLFRNSRNQRAAQHSSSRSLIQVFSTVYINQHRLFSPFQFFQIQPAWIQPLIPAADFLSCSRSSLITVVKQAAAFHPRQSRGTLTLRLNLIRFFSPMSHLLHFYTARWLVLTNYQHHIILFKKTRNNKSHSRLFPYKLISF